MSYGIYKALTGLLVTAGFPPFWLYTRLSGRYMENLAERFGVLPSRLFRESPERPRIWIHAVSLGEVKVAAAIVHALKGLLREVSIVLSTVTEHGRHLAEETFGPEVRVVYAPIDFFPSVRKALASVRPDVLVFLETEIWPAWLSEARRMHIRTALINGRISLRSIETYRRFKFFFREILDHFDYLSMISEADADRILSMGANPEKIRIHGNAKYDLFARPVDPQAEAEARRLLNLAPESRVLIAGSTRGGEEGIILDAYARILQRYPDTILIVAPRHIERSGQIGALIEARGLRYQRRTDLAPDRANRKEQIVILDTFGELFKIYSVGSLVFCGASLVPLGGQNPLEPAAWGKVVLYGPSMDDFREAGTLLEEAGAGIPVTGAGMLAEKAIWFFSHPEVLKRDGERARQAVLNNRGAAEKHARVIVDLLQYRKPGPHLLAGDEKTGALP